MGNSDPRRTHAVEVHPSAATLAACHTPQVCVLLGSKRVSCLRGGPKSYDVHIQLYNVPTLSGLDTKQIIQESKQILVRSSMLAHAEKHLQTLNVSCPTRRHLPMDTWKEMIRTIAQLQRRVNVCDFTRCIPQHNTEKRATPLRPKQDDRDGPERLRHTSFELHSSPRSKVETKVRCAGRQHKETEPIESLRKVQIQGYCSLILSTCSIFESLRLHQDVPHCSLNSPMTVICSRPINQALLFSPRHL